MFKKAFWPFVIVASLSTKSRITAQEDLIPVIREQNRNSRELIRTIYADYDVVSDFIPRGIIPFGQFRVQWWQDGDLIRYKLVRKHRYMANSTKSAEPASPTKVVTLQDDFLIKDGDMLSLRRRPGSESGDATFRPIPGKPQTPHDVWFESLFTLVRNERTGLPQLLEAPKRVKVLEVVRRKEQVYYKLIFDCSDAREKRELEVEVDPRRNYLVTHSVHSASSGKGTDKRETTVLAFREIAPGIQFPMHVEARVYSFELDDQKGNLLAVTETKFHSVVINQPIDPKHFELEIPPRSAVVDYRDNSSYVVGPDGQPKGKVWVVPKPIETEADPTYRERSPTVPPRLWWTLAAIGCIAIFCVMHRWKRVK